MIKRLGLSFSLAAFIYLSCSSQVQAVNTPSFPSCTSPAGATIADYSSGIHGIVGQSQTYTGSDRVYRLNDDQVTQCFCSSDGGTGIQTNWWKYADLSDQEIKILERQGWIMIPNGSLWGLDNAPYLTRNESYSCSGSTGSGGTNSTGGSSSSNSSSGSILGISTFANTGLSHRTGMILIGLFTILLIARKALSRLTPKT